MKKGSVSITTTGTDPNTTRLLLEGQLVIRNAGVIKTELLRALYNSQNLIVAFKHIVKLDVSVLQLLVALQKSAAVLRKDVSFDIEINEHTLSVLQNSGLEKLLLTNFKSQANGIH